MIVYWAALTSTLILVAVGQTFFKLFATSANRLTLILAGLCLVVATLSNYVALQGLDVGVVYMSTALTNLLVLLLAKFLLKEDLTKDHAIAMVLLVAGLAIYVV